MNEEQKRQNVYLPTATVKEIKRIYLMSGRPVHGAIQEVLSRGAELALAEMSGSASARIPREKPGEDLAKSEEITYNPEKIAFAISKLCESIECIRESVSALGMETQAKGPDAQSSSISNNQQRISDLLTKAENGARQAAEGAKGIKGSHHGSERGKRPNVG